MIQFLIAAPRSGSGKTTVTCAMLAALKKRGYDPCAFKCGPDYIDPMFHRAALHVDSHNLDLFLSTSFTVRELYAHYAAGHGAAVCEGAMGFYDGQGMSAMASAWDVAETLDLPVLLVVQPKGVGLTLAAEIQGLMNFKNPSHIVGILLNDCSEKLYKMLKPMLEENAKIPVLGYLPHLPEAKIESRHLGLKTADEISGLAEKIDFVADILSENLDWQKLFELTDKPEPEMPVRPKYRHIDQIDDWGLNDYQLFPEEEIEEPMVRIAVAKDEAFCFTYAETLDVLTAFGANLVFFSPLHDKALPENIDGLYLPGGYPELYAKTLSENESMRNSIRSAYENGLPTVAECGGFLYLEKELEDNDGEIYPMVGVLPGSGVKVGKLVRFGYADLTAQVDSMLFETGEILPIHEFHHWDSTENGEDFSLLKANGTKWLGGFANDHLYAGFPHLYWAGTPLPKRFIKEAERYIEQKEQQK